VLEPADLDPAEEDPGQQSNEPDDGSIGACHGIQPWEV
jgi:hypothetical protein